MKTLLLFLTTLFTATLNAQIVNIPDPNFKYVLLNHTFYGGAVIDTNGDGEIQVAEAEAVTVLYVGDPWGTQYDVSDLTGIEAFTNLIELNCGYNNLTNIDLSQNTALEILNCSNNFLANLNLSQNVNLKLIDCKENNISDIDLTQNIFLEEINIEGNQLSTINLVQNNLLLYLNVENNQISTLNLSQNTNLEVLIANENLLTSIDMSQNINLYFFSANNNQLDFLDLRNGNNINITYFNTENNPNLTCIFVDDATYSSNSPDWYQDPNSTYVETQQECDDLAGIADFWRQQLNIYPNPTHGKLYINSEFRIQNSELIISDILGKTIYKTSLSGKNSQFNLSHLSSGIYFLNIYHQKTKLLTQKLIKL